MKTTETAPAPILNIPQEIRALPDLPTDLQRHAAEEIASSVEIFSDFRATEIRRLREIITIFQKDFYDLTVMHQCATAALYFAGDMTSAHAMEAAHAKFTIRHNDEIVKLYKELES